MMKRMMPKDIPNYKRISPDQLDQRPLNTDEQELIHKFIKEEKAGCFILPLFWIFMSLPIIYLFVKNDMLFETPSVICSLALQLPLIIFIKERIALNKPCKYIKIGILHGIWSLKYPGDENDTRYFYVIFPDSQTYIKEVNCIYKEFRKAEENDKVLVFSLDGEKAYGCLLK